MDYERQRELLNRIVEHESIARTNKETIQHLLFLGFKEEELVHEFNFSMNDVIEASQEMDDYDE